MASFTQDELDTKINSELPGNIVGGVNVTHLQDLLHDMNETIFSGPAGGITEAPLDGDFYARKNGAWDGLNDVFVRWVTYTGSGQSFLNQDMTRDGDWTMIANKNTSDRPAPQPSGTTEDLLPIWTPTTQSARASYTVYNEWTINQSGWIDQYGVDVLTQNVGASHTLKLSVNGVVKDTFTTTPNTADALWQDITPIVVVSGTVLRVTLQVSQVSNNLMYWDQQSGLFATAPVYCSLAQGSKDGAAADTTAYDCHLMFIPGIASPDWDVVAFGGSAAAGGGGATETAAYTVATLPGLFNALCSSSYRSGLRGLRGQRRSDPGRWCRID